MERADRDAVAVRLDHRALAGRQRVHRECGPQPVADDVAGDLGLRFEQGGCLAHRRAPTARVVRA
ncbi:hypothetical protein J2S50_007041 [Streptomyces sp. DSM 40167]|nr:hypothetical protein [Streptomyces sp. DSM 40167]